MRANRMAALVGVLALGLGSASVRGEEPEPLPVKVFILAGQSNMQGQGAIKTLDWLGQDEKYGHLLKEIKNEDGSWKERDDVWIYYPRNENQIKKGKLTVGYGAGDDKIGPELFIGHVLGNHFENPVLLIKTAWGGRSLAVDFRPPSSGGETGNTYNEMIQRADDALQTVGENFPELKDRKVELSGFFWFQGWNDLIDEKKVAEYEFNMVNFIKDIRKAWNAPELPVVIGIIGVNGEKEAERNQRMADLRRAQAAVAEHEEFKGNVLSIPTAPYWDEVADEYLSKHWVNRKWDSEESKAHFETMGTQPEYHYLGSGKIKSLIGYAMGNGMLELLKGEGNRD